jgi:hypothetical protein
MTWRARSFALAAALVAATIAASAQRGGRGAPPEQKSGPWFGTPLPPPLSDPRKPIMKYDDTFAPLPASFPHRTGRHDELLDAAAVKADQKKIVGFSLESLNAGDKVWGRRAATPSFMHTIVPPEGLERAARFHAYFVEKADRADEALIAAGKGSPYQSKEQVVSSEGQGQCVANSSWSRIRFQNRPCDGKTSGPDAIRRARGGDMPKRS